MTKTLKFGLGITENIVGKGKNAGYQNFFKFSAMFSGVPFGRC